MAQSYATVAQTPDAIERELIRFGTIAGVADGIQILGYILEIDPTYFAAAAIAIKLLAIPFWNFRHSNRRGIYYVGVLLLLSTISIASAPYPVGEALLKTVPVSVSLALTLVVTATRPSLIAYGRAGVNVTVMASLLYLAMAARGSITSFFGRYLYFGDSHPNLGSEINAAAVIVACMFYRGWPLLLRLPVLLAPIVLMQGRAGLVASVLAIVIHGVVGFRERYRRTPIFTVLVVLILVPTIAVFMLDDIVATARVVMLIDDPTRGQSTHFVGRGQRWDEAIDLFWQRPILGHGAGVYEEGVDTPHNFFLYGFVNLGATFLLVLWWMAHLALCAFRRSPRSTLILFSFGVLMFFNDRFLNFAPYPFQMYVMLASLASLPYTPPPPPPLRRRPITPTVGPYRVRERLRPMAGPWTSSR